MDNAQAIRDLVGRYREAYERHDTAGCAAVYTVDAVVLSPWGPPIRGREAIGQAHGEWFREGERNKCMTVEALSTEGETGMCLVSFSADVPAEGGGSDKVHGTSLNALRRRDGEDWLIAICSLNAFDNDVSGIVK